MTAKEHYRTVFMSDLHLGCFESRAVEAADFLKRVECETLYLVGDIIDMWCLQKRWHWPESHNRFIRRVLKMAKRGTRVVYIPGNHDDPARRYAGLSFGGVRIALKAVHETADGKQLLIVHGDEFDTVVRHMPRLSALGGRIYDVLLRVNKHYNRVSAVFGRDYWSLSKAIKMRVKSACNFISKFEDALTADAISAGMDGVVCGHIHKGEAREHRSIRYYNCGDWIESSTVIVEHLDGRMELLDGASVTRECAARDTREAMTLWGPDVVNAGSRGATSDAMLADGDEKPDWLDSEPLFVSSWRSNDDLRFRAALAACEPIAAGI